MIGPKGPESEDFCRCRSCGAPIVWIKMLSGRKCPVNAAYIAYEDAAMGTTLVTDDGRAVVKNKGCLQLTHNLKPMSMKGRISHFATCPDAERYRKHKTRFRLK